MDNKIRLTLPSLKVLGVLMNSRRYRASGADIIRGTGLSSGTVYPILTRFETAELLSGEWEDIDPSSACRPRRRYYTLTGIGQRTAQQAFTSFAFQARNPKWA